MHPYQIVVSTERYSEDRKQERFNLYHEYDTSASLGINNFLFPFFLLLQNHKGINYPRCQREAVAAK